MENDSNKLAEYLGRLIGILGAMQDKYPHFTYMFAFNIFIEGGKMISAANMSDELSDGELQDLLLNVHQVFSQKNPSGINFEEELGDILDKLEIDLYGEGPENN